MQARTGNEFGRRSAASLPTQLPIRTISWNSALVSGCTDKRESRRSAIPFNFGLRLISSSVTARGNAFTGARSTALQSPSVAVGSGYASRTTLAMPTISLPMTL